MDLLKLQVENFCCYSKGEIDFQDFASALIIGKIKGSNKFSNGAGKSSIFAAIKYALFNEVDYSTLDRVIRRGTKYCSVALEFRSSVNQEIYRAVRSRSLTSGSELQLYQQVHGEWRPITAQRNAETEKELGKLIKINHKTFCHSVYFSQADLTFAALSPGDRKRALKEVLQLSIYNKYEAATKKKISQVANDLEKQHVLLGVLGDPLADITKFEQELETVNAVHLARKMELDQVKAVVQDIIKQQNQLNEQNKEFQQQKQKRASTEKELQQLNNTIKGYQLKQAHLIGINEKLTKEVDLLLNQSSKQEQLRTKETVEKELSTSTEQFFAHRTQHEVLAARLKELKTPFPEGNLCKHCRQTITDDIRNTCQEAIDQEIRSVEAEMKQTINQAKSLNPIIEACKKELQCIDELNKQQERNQANIQGKQKELIANNSLLKEYSALYQKSQSQLKDLQTHLNAMTLDNTSLEQEVKEVQQKLTVINTECQRLEKEINSLIGQQSILNHRLIERHKDKEKHLQLKQEIMHLERQYIVQQKVATAFGSTGIPAIIIQTILDDYQIAANQLLAQLRPGMQLQFSITKDRSDGGKDDTLNVNYLINGYDLEYAQLSGAQKLLAALSLKLGLASVIKKRLDVDTNFLLIDEADQSLDEGTIEAFEEAIKQLQKEFKVLVITHNSSLKDKFSHMVLVEQDEDLVSTVRMVKE